MEKYFVCYQDYVPCKILLDKHDAMVFDCDVIDVFDENGDYLRTLDTCSLIEN